MYMGELIVICNEIMLHFYNFLVNGFDGCNLMKMKRHV